jgi:hypothetical protein
MQAIPNNRKSLRRVTCCRRVSTVVYPCFAQRFPDGPPTSPALLTPVVKWSSSPSCEYTDIEFYLQTGWQGECRMPEKPAIAVYRLRYSRLNTAFAQIE